MLHKLFKTCQYFTSFSQISYNIDCLESKYEPILIDQRLDDSLKDLTNGIRKYYGAKNYQKKKKKKKRKEKPGILAEKMYLLVESIIRIKPMSVCVGSVEYHSKM